MVDAGSPSSRPSDETCTARAWRSGVMLPVSQSRGLACNGQYSRCATWTIDPRRGSTSSSSRWISSPGGVTPPSAQLSFCQLGMPPDSHAVLPAHAPRSAKSELFPQPLGPVTAKTPGARTESSSIETVAAPRVYESERRSSPLATHGTKPRA
eukprot:scaffold269512_cov31-Tisochrysis_lutea.AAC.5